MNLAEVSMAQLRGLRKRVEIELEAREKQARTEALRKIQGIVNQSGVSLADLLAPGILRLRKPATIKYRHPDSPVLTWSGRGWPPIWVREWEALHGSRDGITVSPSN